ncbi:MAG: RICIN domain-containing protein [Acidimicrobiales bacterium]
MTQAPLRALRLLLARFLPVTLAASLFTTGLVTADLTTDAKATVSDKVQTLTDGVAEPGFTRTADTGQPTQLVGFEWEGRQEGAVEVRAQQDGAWSEWLRVEGDPTEGPDEDSPEHRQKTTAGPVWVGRDVRQVETRVVEGSLSQVKLHALRSEEPKASGGTKPAGAATQPAIVSRAAWGADESYRSLNSGYGCASASYAQSVELAVVHHTASPTNYTPADSAPYMRVIYDFHTHTNEWCDIGYNFVVDRFGTVFEGRFGGTNRAVVGAHALNFNTGSTGVALLGTFGTDAVPSPMYNGLRSLLAWKLSIHGVNPSAVISFNGRTLPTVVGHRDVNATDCPGNMPHSLLPRLRNDLAGAAAPLPAPFLVQSALSAQLIDVSGGSLSQGAGVIQWPLNGGLNQQWRFAEFGIGNGVYSIVSRHSGLVLDVNGGSTDPGAAVIQWPWNGGVNQLWYVAFVGEPVGGTRLMVVVSMSSGLVLDLNGASMTPGAELIQWPWNGGANQFWWRYPL